jgi:hypothetical protein
VLCCALWYVGGRVTLYHAFLASCASFDLSSAPSMMESVQDQREGLAQPLLSLIKRALMRCR